MEEKGWISKSDDPNHGRILLIGLTLDGQAVYERCKAKAMGFENKMLAGLPAENVMMLKATIQRLIANLKQDA